MPLTAEERASIDIAVAEGRLRRVEIGDSVPRKFKSRRGQQFDAEAYLLRHRYLEERGLSVFTSPRDKIIAVLNEAGLGSVTGRTLTTFTIDVLRAGIRRALAG